MLGWLAAYKYVSPTPQVGIAFVWEINQKIVPTPNVILSMRVRILLLPRVRIQRLTATPNLSRISLFQTRSLLVRPQIQRNIRISATLICWTCRLFVGQHSAPYNIAGLIAVYKTCLLASVVPFCHIGHQMLGATSSTRCSLPDTAKKFIVGTWFVSA